MIYDRVTGFVLQEIVQETDLYTYYKGYTLQEQKPVLLKIRSSGASPDDIRSMQSELELAKTLNSAHFLVPIRFDSFQGSPALVYEDFGSMPLWQFTRLGTYTIEQKIKVAISLVRSIGELHSNKYVHSTIRPHHIFIQPTDQSILLAGLDSCLPFQMIPTNASKLAVRHEQLPYMSPEQTGRLEQTISYQSDFYSLGVVLFEWFTDQLPFEAVDLSEWVYAHVAREPAAPQHLNKALPEMLTRIIKKLLSKSAEDRYHSSIGLEKDLLLCLQLHEEISLTALELGKHDQIHSLHFPQKLYGRERELDQLAAVYEEAGQGYKRLSLVSGYAGVGKTSLLVELRNRFPGMRLAEGKCHPAKTASEFDPILQALKQLIYPILLDTGDRVEEWKKRITTAIGPYRKLIVNDFPELSLLLGKSVEEIAVQETNDPYPIVQILINLIRTFCQKDQPLVLQIEDLQWADRATIDFLIILLSVEQIRYLMIICTFRDLEITAQHPYYEQLQLLHNDKAHILEINLMGLDYSSIFQLVKDSIPSHTPISHSLVKEIQYKSQGNPFYLKQLLQSFYDNELLIFDETSNSWSYDLLRIQTEPSLEHVADLIIYQFHKWMPDLQNFLMLTSCMGEKFDWQLIKRISSEQKPELLVRLAIKEGILIQLDQPVTQNEHSGLQFQFVHPKVQEAIYEQLTKEAKVSSHQAIGRVLLEEFQGQVPEEKLFELLHHLNLGAEQHMSVQDRLFLAELNSRAGRKAKASLALEAALQYLERGLEQLSRLGDKGHKVLKYSLKMDTAECHYLNNEYDIALETYTKLLFEQLSVMERSEVYGQMMKVYSHNRQYKEAIEIGYKALKLFDLELPEQPGRMHWIKELLWVKWRARRSRRKDEIELPILGDPMLIRMMAILMNLIHPAYYVNKELSHLVILKLFRLTLKHGQTEFTSSILCNYGMLLSTRLLSFEEGFEIGSQAILLTDRYNHLYWRGHSYLIYATFIHHWKRPLRESIDYLRLGLSSSLESGNRQLVGHTCAFMSLAQILQGVKLDAINNEIEEYLQANSLAEHEVTGGALYPFLKQWIDLLKGNMEPYSNAANRFFEHHYPIGNVEDTASYMLVYPTYLMQAHLLFGNNQEAVKLGIETDVNLKGKLMLMTVPEFYLYFGLALARQYAEVTKDEQKRYWSYLRRIWRMFRNWSKLSPVNYEHKWLMIGAEMARIRGNDTVAMTNYEKAIQSAKQHDFQHCLALFGEYTGAYYLQKGMYKIAKSYLQDAYYDYLDWGAYGKASQLQIKYATLFHSAPKGGRGLIQTSDAPSGHVYHVLSQAIDYSTMVEMFHAISGEIVFDKLLEKLIRLLMENAGAQRGLLLLDQDGRSCVEAEGELDGSVSVLKSKPLDEIGNCSHSIIQYTINTQKPVVLHDASRDILFRNDVYVQQNQTKSLLCMPILKQGKPIGILYMENNAAVGTFTPIRLEVLSLLSSQAAIAIENARLYTDMETKVRERTLELQKANHELQIRNEDLLRMETSRRHLLTNISHDLRTPMTLIQGYVEGILEGVITDEEKKTKYLTMIYTKVIALNHLITDLFQLTTLEARRIPFTIQSIRLTDYKQHLQERFELDIQNAALVFQITLAEQLTQHGARIEIDLDRMDQVFTNLIFNSIRYTQTGGIIHIQLERGQEGHLLIRVQDTGSGIAEEDLSFVFDRFYKGNKSRSGKSEGSGLGLAICKEIVESHGGNIWVESKSNEGSVFCFILPLLLEESTDELVTS